MDRENIIFLHLGGNRWRYHFLQIAQMAKKSKNPNNNRLQLYQTEEYSDLYKSKKPSRVMVGHRSITNQKSPDDG